MLGMSMIPMTSYGFQFLIKNNCCKLKRELKEIYLHAGVYDGKTLLCGLCDRLNRHSLHVFNYIFTVRQDLFRLRNVDYRSKLCSYKNSNFCLLDQIVFRFIV